MLPPQEISRFFDQNQENCDSPPVISFLIPPDVFSTNSDQNSPQSQNPSLPVSTVRPGATYKRGDGGGGEGIMNGEYLEVTCQVIGMNYLPVAKHPTEDIVTDNWCAQVEVH